MKSVVAIIVLSLAIGFAVPALAASADGPGLAPITKADCEKLGMKWNTYTNKCEAS